jgi:hypothetical protein
MKKTVRVMLNAFMLCVASGQAAQPAGDTDRPAVREAETPRPPPDGSKKTPGKPAGSFTPSEQVGADSAVSFPVDI